MNLVGKIFVVLIAVMCLVFMSFAMAVYATHKNWKDVVENPDNGLNKQLKDQDARNKELTAEKDKLTAELERRKDGQNPGGGQTGNRVAGQAGRLGRRASRSRTNWRSRSGLWRPP